MQTLRSCLKALQNLISRPTPQFLADLVIAALATRYCFANSNIVTLAEKLHLEMFYDVDIMGYEEPAPPPEQIMVL